MNAEHHVWLVDVERVWKGHEKLRRTIKLMDVYAKMDCEFYFELGQRTRVLAPDNESLWLEDLIIRQQGPGEPPRP